LRAVVQRVASARTSVGGETRGARSGESFISPDEQRAAIEAWAKASGNTIMEWHEDLNQSGGTLDRPAFNAAIEGAETG
jgi:DNA invertase Pin-like site-specific DNA recombinase